MQHPVTSATASRRHLSDAMFDACAVTLAFAAYFAVFIIVRRDGAIISAAIASLINLAPLIVLTIAVRAVLGRYVIRTSLLWQIASHILLAIAFAVTWEWMITVLVGMREGASLNQFVVRPFFPDPAVVWQWLQGLTVYALIASLHHIRMKPELPGVVIAGGEDSGAKDSGLTRYFLRRQDDIYPIDVTQIISIAGADDYAEVTTIEDQHLVRTTLAEFEDLLDQVSFLRVHRSRIVNMDHVVRAEPSGDGRILLHMQNQDTIMTSRAGAKLVRERVF